MKKFILLFLLVSTLRVQADLYFNEAVLGADLAVKATPGDIRGFNIINTNASATYLHFYDAAVADVTVGTTAQLCAPIAVPATGAIFVPVGDAPLLKFTKAITIAATTSPLSNVATAPGVGLVVTIIYQ